MVDQRRLGWVSLPLSGLLSVVVGQALANEGVGLRVLLPSLFPTSGGRWSGVVVAGTFTLCFALAAGANVVLRTIGEDRQRRRFAMLWICAGECAAGGRHRDGGNGARRGYCRGPVVAAASHGHRRDRRPLDAHLGVRRCGRHHTDRPATPRVRSGHTPGDAGGGEFCAGPGHARFGRGDAVGRRIRGPGRCCSSAVGRGDHRAPLGGSGAIVGPLRSAAAGQPCCRRRLRPPLCGVRCSRHLPGPGRRPGWALRGGRRGQHRSGPLRAEGVPRRRVRRPARQQRPGEDQHGGDGGGQNATPRAITLAPGEVAHAQLTWRADAGAYDREVDTILLAGWAGARRESFGGYFQVKNGTVVRVSPWLRGS